MEGSRSPRGDLPATQYQVILPGDGRSAHTSSGRADSEGSVVASWRAGAREELLGMHNKAPEWSEELQTFTLEYNGRATEASVKNIQLVRDDYPSGDLFFQVHDCKVIAT